MAVPIPIRETIVQRRLQGHSLASIAAALSLKYQTVRNIWQRYRLRGVPGLTPDYHCRNQPHQASATDDESRMLAETPSPHLGPPT